MSERGHLDTERASLERPALDRLPVAEACALFDRADAEAVRAVAEARDEVVAAIELVAERLAAGGRLVYVGAGTSGRLGALDASECPPTFGTAPDLVQGRIAGGERAFFRAVEGAEDSREEGERCVADVGAKDVVFGISAGGTTPFVHAAIGAAKRAGAATVFLACVPREHAPDEADVSIRLATGPELLAGSTRLKAGTATKLVLNRITTLAMARLGRVFGDRMVGLAARGNAKLTDRATRIVRELTELDEEGARAALAEADGRLEVAVLAARLGLDVAGASARLAAAGGSLRRALEDAEASHERDASSTGGRYST